MIMYVIILNKTHSLTFLKGWGNKEVMAAILEKSTYMSIKQVSFK